MEQHLHLLFFVTQNISVLNFKGLCSDNHWSQTNLKEKSNLYRLKNILASTGSSLEIGDIGAKKYSGVLHQKAPLNGIYCWACRIVHLWRKWLSYKTMFKPISKPLTKIVHLRFESGENYIFEQNIAVRRLWMSELFWWTTVGFFFSKCTK